MVPDGKRIYHGNLNDYMINTTKKTFKTIQKIPFLLQKDYGLPKDCTLTSFTTLLSWMLPDLEVQEIYNQVEYVAKKFGYNGVKSGTNPIVMRSILNSLFNIYGLKYKAFSRYLKNVCYSFNTIKKLIDENKPVVLNLHKDGRNYYSNHTVLISGYVESDEYQMLAIHDNWASTTSYIDFKKLSMVSSIISFN